MSGLARLRDIEEPLQVHRPRPSARGFADEAQQRHLPLDASHRGRDRRNRRQGNERDVPGHLRPGLHDVCNRTALSFARVVRYSIRRSRLSPNRRSVRFGEAGRAVRYSPFGSRFRIGQIPGAETMFSPITAGVVAYQHVTTRSLRRSEIRC